MIKATGTYADSVFALDEALAERHPALPEHMYGAFVGIAGTYRSKGFCPRRVRELFPLFDRMQLPPYSEVNSGWNGRFDDLIGVPCHGAPISLPRCDTDIFPVWREPQLEPEETLVQDFRGQS